MPPKKSKSLTKSKSPKIRISAQKAFTAAKGEEYYIIPKSKTHVYKNVIIINTIEGVTAPPPKVYNILPPPSGTPPPTVAGGTNATITPVIS
jgi:hypothetical protein